MSDLCCLSCGCLEGVWKLPGGCLVGVIEGMIESKNLLCKSCWGSNNLGFDLFPDLVGHFGLSRRSSVAVPPSPLGWYYLMISFIMRNSEQLRRTLGMLLTRKIVTMQIRITAMFLSSLACTFLTLLTLQNRHNNLTTILPSSYLSPWYILVQRNTRVVKGRMQVLTRRNMFM